MKTKTFEEWIAKQKKCEHSNTRICPLPGHDKICIDCGYVFEKAVESCGWCGETHQQIEWKV